MNDTPPTVLVVDDDLVMRDVLREMLGQLGLTSVHYAADGRKALKLLAGMQAPPDYVLCDVFMPDMNGIEFLEQLANLHYAGEVVIMSAGDLLMLTLSRDIAAGNGLNVVGALAKPIDLQQLSALLSH